MRELPRTLGSAFGPGGLTVRDCFAAATLSGLVTQYSTVREIATMREIVRLSYEVAEAMLAEKDKRDQHDLR